MLDAYTIKKMLPRLIIAVLLVNLSWFICTSLLATTSVVGNAIRDIMWSPFLRAGYDNTLSIGGKLTTLLWGGAAIGAFPAALWATIGGGWAVILSMILSIAAFLFLAVIVLTLREVVLVFLIIISPLALVAWVLPGTEQWAKRWWGLYSKLLLMFPAFMALLAAGEIMSTVTNKHKGGADADPINNLIAIAMYMIPFFMLPFLFKAMGGFLGQVTGMINDKEKGLLDRSRGWAKDKTSNSSLASEKNRRKELGAARRKRTGDARVIRRPQTRWDQIQSRMTRGRLGIGIEEADIESLKAQEAQEQFRAQTAKRASFDAQIKGRQLDMSSSHHDTQGSIATYRDHRGIQHTLQHGDKDGFYKALAQGHRVTVTDAQGAQTVLDGSDEATATAAMYSLSSLGRDGVIRELQNEAYPPGHALAGQLMANQANLQSAINDNASALISKAPDIIKGAGPAFTGSLSAEALSSFSNGTVDQAFEYVFTQGTQQQQQALINEAANLAQSEKLMGTTSAGTAEALYHQLQNRGLANQATLDAFRDKFGG